MILQDILTRVLLAGMLTTAMSTVVPRVTAPYSASVAALSTLLGEHGQGAADGFGVSVRAALELR